MEMKKNEGWDYYFVTLKGNRLIYQDSPRLFFFIFFFILFVYLFVLFVFIFFSLHI